MKKQILTKFPCFPTELGKKKVNVFGKKLPVFVIVLLGLALVSAALLPYFAQITGDVIVSQGLQVGGIDWDGTQTQWSATLTSLEEGTLSSGDYSLINDANVNAEIQFVTKCDEATDGVDGCNDVIITEMVELSVTGFTGSDEFESDHYKKSYYNSPVTDLSGLTNVTYSFKITNRDGFTDTTAPYIVLIGDGIGTVGVAVQIIPDGIPYITETEYTKTIDDTTTFHIPGDENCAGQDYATGCTLTQIKGYYPGAKLSQMSVAIGAWSGADNLISAWMGIDKINGVQAEHKKLVVSPKEISSLKVVTDFPKLMKPDTYTFTTDVLPVTP